MQSETVRLRPVLLAVTGLTPQVVTETLFALLKRAPAEIPDEVHIVTTAEGAERVRMALLSEQPGWLERFSRDFNIPSINLPAQNIHVIRGVDGEPLNDIRSAEDNVLAADQIAELVRRLTADDGTALHISMAGGRKTLGFFAGYTLSLWGRAQDRLSHVLVSEPFEQSHDFFYPTPYERIIQTRANSWANCAEAEVTLADIPFVRLRHGLPSSFLETRSCFADAVHAAQTLLAAPRLVIDLDGQRVDVGGRRLPLPPADLAFLSWFARRAAQKLPPLACPSEGVPSLAHARDYLSEYRRIRGVLGDDERTTARYARGMAKADFEERKSKLKRLLVAALNMAAQPYLVRGNGRRPMSYRLDLPPSSIEFGPVAKPVARTESSGHD